LRLDSAVIRTPSPISASRLVSIQTGRPRTVGDPDATGRMERQYSSAIWKAPVQGPVRVGRLGLAGDAVANTKVHGGPEQAVLMYALSHYPAWERELGRPLVPGAFGENLSVVQLTEDTACIGDVFEIGDARLQVSQPRQPCATLARRHQVPDMIDIVLRNGRSGWYLRILREGSLEAGQEVRLMERPHPEWTVRRAARAMVARARDRLEAATLAACPALSPGWRATLTKV
jgi:MOSC domain-containing protein YiiM